MPATWEHDRNVQQRAAACSSVLAEAALRLRAAAIEGPNGCGCPCAIGGRAWAGVQGSGQAAGGLHSRAIGIHQSMRRG